jgi:hypothetical protein
VEPGELVGLSSDDPVAVERYVRQLMEGVDGEIAARLLDIGSS